MEESVADTYSVSIKGSLRGSNKNWVITEVYGPTNCNLQSEFLAKLERSKSMWNGPRCIGGDFNEVHNPGKESGGHFSRGMRLFLDFIGNMRLRELPLDPSFTWCNFQTSPLVNWIDYMSLEWDEAFPNSKGEILA